MTMTTQRMMMLQQYHRRMSIVRNRNNDRQRDIYCHRSTIADK
jgi:hypothetical protein